MCYRPYIFFTFYGSYNVYKPYDVLYVLWIVQRLMGRVDHDSGRGAARAEDAQGTPTQSHISPSILVYEETALGLAK